MSVSGSGNVSPSGANWDPNIMGKSTDASHEPQEGRSLNTFDQGSLTTSSSQAFALSGAAFDYESEVQINESKYKKTQDKTLSVKNKLRGQFSKAQASVRGFLSGFGSRASRVSARKAEIKEGGRSYLPSNTEIVNSKGNRISPELRSFYLQASGVNSQPVDIQTLSYRPTAVHSFSSSSFHPVDIQGIDLHSLNALLMASHKTQLHEDTINLWLMARLGGEMISILLDPNVETSSLLRRASTVGNESLDDLVLMSRNSIGSQIARRSLPNEDDGVKQSENSSASTQKTETSEKTEVKKEGKDDASEKLLGLSKMASLLLATPSSETFTPYSLVSVDSGKTFAPVSSSSIIRTFKSKHQPLGIAKRSSQASFYSSTNQQTQVVVRTSEALRMESPYRFPLNQEDVTAVQRRNDVSSFIVVERNSDVAYSLPHTSLIYMQYNASAEDLNGEIIISSFHFSVERGVSLLPEAPVSAQKYLNLLQAHKGPGAPPDPLIYQYRNVSIDPPIILRSLQPFASSSRLQVQGKPEAASVHDDSGREQQFSDRQQDSNPEQQEQNHKRKSKTID